MPRFQCFLFLKRWIKDNEKWYMSTIKNGQILLYCQFNKIIKGPGTSFCACLQHAANNMLEIFVIQHTSIWPKFILIGLIITRKQVKRYLSHQNESYLKGFQQKNNFALSDAKDKTSGLLNWGGIVNLSLLTAL